MGLPAIERKNVLDLFPYFNQNNIVVVDVGSNKGEWFDIVNGNIDEAYLFDGNPDMIAYCRVKYDYPDEVRLIAKAVSNRTGIFDFNQFTKNNGLSSLLKNEKWKDLEQIQTVIECTTLQREFPDLRIDFLKIDVEGAEMFVLKGAKDILKENRVRFIQVEKAEHIELSGYTFEQLEAYLKSFGYAPIPNEDTENVIFAMEGFTQDWNAEFKKNTKGIKIDTALEIGCFEGLTTRYICDNLLNPGGRMICVDPLTDEYLPGHKDNEMFKGQYERFTRNTRNYPVELIRKKSNDAYDQLKDLRFGLIYIDGDHTEAGVFSDAVHYWNVLQDGWNNPGGYMLFDDYGQSEETKRGIDRFLETQKGNYEILVKDYQVLIHRIR